MERNHVIDLLKFTCAILVVFLHTKSAYHDALTPITRCAVPCFFMISDITAPLVVLLATMSLIAFLGVTKVIK